MNRSIHSLLALSLVLLSTTSAPFAAEPGGAAIDQKLVFHLDEMRNARWSLMLARSYLDDNPGARLVVVSYGPGVDFLLRDAQDRRGTPYAPAVDELTTRGVTFRVCGTTLTERDIARDTVLDGVEIVPSGLAEIVRLQLGEGYAYVKP